MPIASKPPTSSETAPSSPGDVTRIGGDRIPYFRLFLGTITFALVATELVVTVLSQFFLGRIAPDYLITGAITSLLVSSGVAILLLNLIRRLARTERALQRSKNNLNQAQHIAHLGSWELDLNSSRLWWSDETFNIFEIDRDRFDASYQAFLALVHPDDRDALDRAYQASVAQHSRYDIIHRLLFPDGRIKYVNERCEHTYGTDGQVLRSIGTVQDITKQHLAEQELREREHELDIILENLPSAVFVKDAEQLRYVRLNQACEHMMGHPREQIVGRNDYDFFPPDQADFFTSKDRVVLNSGTPLDIPEEPINTPEGPRTLHTHKVRIVDEEGRPKYLLGIAEDITDKILAEQALRESEQRFHAIFDAAMDGIMLADTATRQIVDANRSMARMLGYDLRELKGLNVRDVHPQDALPMVTENFELQRQQIRSTARETPMQRKDGSVFHADISTAVMSLRDREYMVGVFHDVSERIIADAALRKAHEELEMRVAERTQELSDEIAVRKLAEAKAEAANQAKSDFLANMSHE
ncbi:MAG: PAS domain S-box protein, partial [Gammaproteobacteria bacterium]|nr:PAS domain S-box protein [Gammaproteobacteria bacterium]